MVGRCLLVYGLSSPMCCNILGFDYPVLYLHLFKAFLLFSPLGFCIAF
jgi:hypothetical protein